MTAEREHHLSAGYSFSETGNLLIQGINIYHRKKLKYYFRG
jgi:hypothetical protein